MMDDLRRDNNRLQEKLEIKEKYLLQLMSTNSTILRENGMLVGEMSGLNVVKSMLKEKEDENAQLK